MFKKEMSIEKWHVFRHYLETKILKKIRKGGEQWYLILEEGAVTIIHKVRRREGEAEHTRRYWKLTSIFLY